MIPLRYALRNSYIWWLFITFVKRQICSGGVEGALSCRPRASKQTSDLVAVQRKLWFRVVHAMSFRLRLTRCLAAAATGPGPGGPQMCLAVRTHIHLRPHVSLSHGNLSEYFIVLSHQAAL